MLRKKLSNQNGHQDLAPNMDKRRGAVYRFDCARVSPPDRSCFVPSHHHQHGIDDDMIDEILNNQQNSPVHV